MSIDISEISANGTLTGGSPHGRSGTQAAGTAGTRTAAGATPASGTPNPHLRALLITLVLALVALALRVRETLPYTSGSDFGYGLGVAGASLMGGLLFYSLRKRVRVTQPLGPVRHWFRFHMFAGIAGPLLILFHSTFRVGSFNAAIALASMLLVAASGLVGRFLYRRIHLGLYGREASLKELEAALDHRLAGLELRLADQPRVRAIIDACLTDLRTPPAGGAARLRHFLGMSLRRWRCNRAVRQLIPGETAVRRAIATTLVAAQEALQFNVFVRLFALWHVIHIPFLGMLALTAIAHIVAVHTY